jgi:hypothetical protein
MPKSRKAKPRNGEKVSNDKTPFAPGGGGVPFGWTENSKPTKAEPTKLPVVIRVEHPIEKNSYERNVLALARLAKKLTKDGSAPIVSPKIKSVIDIADKHQKKTKASKKGQSTKGASRRKASTKEVTNDES